MASSWSLPEDLDLGAVWVPAPKRHVFLARPEVLKVSDRNLGGGQNIVKAEDVVCGRCAEADVEPVREWLVLCDGDERGRSTLWSG